APRSDLKQAAGRVDGPRAELLPRAGGAALDLRLHGAARDLEVVDLRRAVGADVEENLVGAVRDVDERHRSPERMDHGLLEKGREGAVGRRRELRLDLLRRPVARHALGSLALEIHAVDPKRPAGKVEGAVERRIADADGERGGA